jgi:hypothetical protein
MEIDLSISELAMVRATRYHLFFRKTFLKSCIPPILILLTNFMGGLMMDTDARWDTDCITYIHSLSWKQCPFPGDASAWKRVFRENRLPMFVLLNEVLLATTVAQKYY